MIDNGVDREQSLWRALVLSLVTRHWIVLCVATIFVRALAMAVLGDGFTADPDSYRRLAEDWRATGVYGLADRSQDPPQPGKPTAFRPPLYPLTLSILVWRGTTPPIAIGVLHLFLGVATVALVYGLARLWRLRTWSYLAATLVAIDPILLHQSTSIMTETLAAFLATLALFLFCIWMRLPSASAAASAGFACGCAVLCRPTFLPWLPVLMLLAATSKRQRARSICLFIATSSLVILPWGVRNAYSLGQFKLTTTHGGYTVLLGNNPSFFQYLENPNHRVPWNGDVLADAWRHRHLTTGAEDPLWDDLDSVARLSNDKTAVTTEAADDRLAYQLSQRFIRDDPAGFFSAVKHRVRRFWGWLPEPLTDPEARSRRWQRIAIGIWYGGISLLAVVGLIRLRPMRVGWRAWSAAVLLVLVFTSAHAIYWSNMRMRAPCIPVVGLFAAAAFGNRKSRVRRADGRGSRHAAGDR